MEATRIIILASGSGTNAENIIKNFHHSNNLRVLSVFSNRADAGVLERAQRLNVPAHVFSKDEMQNGRLLAQIRSLQPDLIILAGFLWLLPSDIIKSYPNRIINIHPALLPAYGGKGMYGERVHEAVIKSGDLESGITIHLVNEHYDEGAILFQARCPVVEGDTAGSLAQRVHALEYEYFPEAIKAYIERGYRLPA